MKRHIGLFVLLISVVAVVWAENPIPKPGLYIVDGDQIRAYKEPQNVPQKLVPLLPPSIRQQNEKNCLFGMHSSFPGFARVWGGGESLINPWLADQFKEQENDPTGSPVSFSISGNILLPSDTVATLAASLKVVASLSSQINPGLNFLRFRVRATDALGTTLAGPFAPDAAGRFSVTGIPGGSNVRIECMASNDQPVL